MKKVIRLVSCMLLAAGICGDAFAGANETVVKQGAIRKGYSEQFQGRRNHS